jgi:Sulfotransferase domain
MYRACSTWQYEVVAHLVEERWHGERLGYLSAETYAKTDDSFSGILERGRRGRDTWRALKSHEGGRSFARALRSGRALAVYAFRDLREVVHSLMRKRAVSFQELLRHGMIHQLLANDAFWRAQPRVLIQRYEDLIADPVTGVLQIARHLGLALTRGEAAEIADEYSIASNQARINSLLQRLHDAGIDLTNPINHQVCDPTTLLHWNHLGPGGAGSWHDRASAREIAALGRICGDWLERNGYESDRADIAKMKPTGVDLFLPSFSIDVVVGRTVFLMRAATDLCPWGSRLVKRLLGIPKPNALAALPWREGEAQAFSGPAPCRGATGCEDIPAAAAAHTHQPGHLV